MGKLIDLDTTINAVVKESQVDGAYGYMDTKSIVDLLNDLPSARSEIIRCGECKYAEAADKEDNQDGYTCQFHRGSIWFSGSYCSWAERREE